MLLILFRLCLKIPVLWKYCYIYNNINTVKNKLEKEWHFGFYLDRIKYLLIRSLTNVSVMIRTKAQQMIQNSWSVCHESHLFRKRQQNRNRCCSVWMQISRFFVCKQKSINILLAKITHEPEGSNIIMIGILSVYPKQKT